MRIKIISTLLAGAIAAAAGTAIAEPLRLSDDQLDTVSAGSVAIGLGTATAFGDVISSTQSTSGALAVDGTLAAAANVSTALGASLLFGAVASTTSTSAAALP